MNAVQHFTTDIKKHPKLLFIRMQQTKNRNTLNFHCQHLGPPILPPRGRPLSMQADCVLTHFILILISKSCLTNRIINRWAGLADENFLLADVRLHAYRPRLYDRFKPPQDHIHLDTPYPNWHLTRILTSNSNPWSCKFLEEWNAST